MSDHNGYTYPPAAGYGAYMLLRGLISHFQQPKKQSPAHSPKPPLLGLRAAGVNVPIITPPPRPPTEQGVPVLRRIGDQGILAWRTWRLATFMSRTPDEESGPRLLSLSAPRIWNGPVATSEKPRVEMDLPSGVYALKIDVGVSTRIAGSRGPSRFPDASSNT